MRTLLFTVILFISQPSKAAFERFTFCWNDTIPIGFTLGKQNPIVYYIEDRVFDAIERRFEKFERNLGLKLAYFYVVNYKPTCESEAKYRNEICFVSSHVFDERTIKGKTYKDRKIRGLFVPMDFTPDAGVQNVFILLSRGYFRYSINHERELHGGQYFPEADNRVTLYSQSFFNTFVHEILHMVLWHHPDKGNIMHWRSDQKGSDLTFEQIKALRCRLRKIDDFGDKYTLRLNHPEDSR